MSSAQIDVLAVIRAPLEQYPPSLLQVSLLAESGLRVGVADCAHEDYPEFTFAPGADVSRYRITRHTQLYKEKSPPIFRRFLRSFLFERRVRRLIRTLRPRVVIAYDPNGMIAAGKLWESKDAPVLIWHYHELFLPCDTGGGFLSRRAVSFACSHANEPDLVVFPDRGRADLFSETVGLTNPPVVVMNCPRRLETIPAETLTKRLADHGFDASQRVFFQGWIGPSRCFEAIIKSMPGWPEDAILVLVGPVTAAYRESLLALAAETGVADRVAFLGSVPYQDLASLAPGAAVGLSIVAGKEDEPNWQLNAGAINKRFEYMAAGITQVSNTGPGMKEIVEEHGCGLLVDPDNPEEIGAAVSNLLSGTGEGTVTAENARRAHRERFCYEVQFQPLLERIRDWCAAN